VRARATWALGLIAVLALLSAGSASASYDLIGSGSGKITLDKGFSKLLKRNGVVLSGRKGAKVKGKVVTLPAVGGKADPTIKKAEIDLGGELFFAHGKQSVNVRSVTLKTKATPVFAKVSGGQLKLVKASKVTLERDGFGNELLATKLKLTQKTAVRLNKKLHVEIFKEGQKFGALRSATQPKTVAVLPVGLLTLSLDPTMVAKLDANSVSINPQFPAEHQGPIFTMPIVEGGQIAPDGKSGTLRTGGSMELLHLGAGQLFWKEAWFDFGGPFVTSEENLVKLEPAGTFGADLGRVPYVDMKVPGGGFTTAPDAQMMSVSGAALTLQPETASLFNKGLAEGKDVFHAGELLGTVSFSAKTQ
jgi:hypothetical protein